MKEAFAAFANPMIFLFLGGFIIAKAMMVNGLDKRIAYGNHVDEVGGRQSAPHLLAIGLACALLRMDQQHCHGSHDVPYIAGIARCHQ